MVQNYRWMREEQRSFWKEYFGQVRDEGMLVPMQIRDSFAFADWSGANSALFFPDKFHFINDSLLNLSLWGIVI